MKCETQLLGEIINFKRGYDLPSRVRKSGIVPIISSSGITDYHSEAAKSGEGVETGRYGTLIENNLKRVKLLEEKAFLSYKAIVKIEKMEEFAIEEVCQTPGGGTRATGNPQFWNE